MLLKLSLLLLLSALVSAENVFEAYRRIPGRVPIIPEEIVNKTIRVKSLEQCKEACLTREKLDFVFSKDFFHSRDEMACICLPKYLWYRHGLVASKNADLYTRSSGDSTLNNFLFLDSAPTQDSRLTTEHSTKASVEECALTCLNYNGKLACYAFLFDIVSRECFLYSNSHLRDGGFEEEHFVNGVNKLYFEKLSQFELYFIPMPRTRLADGLAPTVVPGQRLENCSMLCVLQKDCLSFNYNPKSLTCELLSQTQRDTVNMKSDSKYIHFEMIPNAVCSDGRSDARWAVIRSPGWPYQLSKQFMKNNTCNWDILTPWGLTVKLDYIYFHLEHSGGACSQSLQIGEQKPMCTSSSQPYKQTSEVTTFNLSVNKWPSPSKELDQRIGFLMTYSLDWTIESDMRDTGVIACPGFPKAMTLTKTSWNILTDKPNQKVLIEFQAFNMKESDLTSDKGYLKFLQNGIVKKECKGEHLEPNCQESMTFYGKVRLEFYSGLYPKNEYPPGFKLIYKVGDTQSSLKDLTGTSVLMMDKEKVMIKEIDLQTRYDSVDQVIKIRNPDKNGRIELQILRLYLAGSDKENACSQDSLRVMDPFSKHVNFTFCGQTTPQETISSVGNELHVIIKVEALPYTDKFKPERTFVIQANKKTTIPQEIIGVEDEGSIALTENEYLPKKNIKWIVKGTEVLEPKLVFLYAHLAEFKFHEQRFCDNDRLSIKHGSEFVSSCGRNQSLANKAFYTNNNEIEITFKSDDIISGPGFSADVEMISTSRCKPGEILKVTANETDYLMSDNYPRVQNSKRPCSWQLMSENSTGVLVTVLEGEMFLSTEDTNEEKSMQVVGKKVLHLPTDAILSWSGGTKGTFLATIENLDLTTTMAPTTTEPTTSTPEVTTEVPTSPTTEAITSSVLPPDFNRQREKKKNPAPMIGGAIGAVVVVLVILALIVWRVRENRRLEIIEPPGDFVNSNLFQRPDEVIRNYGQQAAFENPAYVNHQSPINDFNNADNSDYVMMGTDDDDHRQFSHLSSNLNSMYGTSNPYEEYTP